MLRTAFAEELEGPSAVNGKAGGGGGGEDARVGVEAGVEDGDGVSGAYSLSCKVHLEVVVERNGEEGVLLVVAVSKQAG